MLFKFKSKACADLIMLELDGRRILKAMIGHDPVKGIVVVQDLSAVLARLDAAVAQDEALRQAHAARAQARAAGDDVPEDQEKEALPAIRLAQRAAPMQQMIRRCMAEEVDLVWGV
jgi:tRNA C32,U32 (ribose-2'-O)-methylase TrmJ